MLRGRSRAVAKQTLAADHRSHPRPPPSPHDHDHHHQNPPPLSRFLSRFIQFAVGTPRTPSLETPASRNGGARFGGREISDRVHRRSWELEPDVRGISLVVSTGRSKLVLFGAEVRRVRTGDPGRPVSADEPAATRVRFVKTMRRPKSSRRWESFLSSCYTCKKIIEPTEDIYIYRGEKAFCSWDCRHAEILRDTALNLNDDDDVIRNLDFTNVTYA